jgi:predicted ATPase
MENNSILKQLDLKNFLSLHEVSIPLRPLTVLAGPNASGKSNILRALHLLKVLMVTENLPDSPQIQSLLWAGTPATGQIDLKIIGNLDQSPVIYQIGLQTHSDRPIALEELRVNNLKVIAVNQGKGEIRDEDGQNPIKYSSHKLALKSAGDYGERKTVTTNFLKFIKTWELFNFDPDLMRGGLSSLIAEKVQTLDTPIQQLDPRGVLLNTLLWSWYQDQRTHFQAVSDLLQRFTQFGITSLNDDENRIGILEGYEKPIPLSKASDGTLRLLAYYTLLEQPKLPPLIAIEEPERNLHPKALIKVANLLEALAERTQVILTTHSSQLLDLFNKDNLGKQLGVLLLVNKLGSGTEVINLEEEQQRRESLQIWIDNFGIGSAIFDSERLQDLMEE